MLVSAESARLVTLTLGVVLGESGRRARARYGGAAFPIAQRGPRARSDVE